MTSLQVVETSVKVTTNSPSQDYPHPDDHNFRTYDMTPGFKPFTIILNAVFRVFTFLTHKIRSWSLKLKGTTDCLTKFCGQLFDAIKSLSVVPGFVYLVGKLVSCENLKKEDNYL